jgi:putative ABC transport system permease protein
MIDQSVGEHRFRMFVLGVFAVASPLLAAVGVCGVISYHVAQRTRKIGIRMALGAQCADIVSLVTKCVPSATAAGVAIGAALARAGSGLMRSLLFDVTLTDAATYAIGASALFVTAAAAAVVPTLRHARQPGAGHSRRVIGRGRARSGGA